MIDGAFATVGSLQRLQERYCTSYFVEISLLADTDDRAEDRVIGAFSESGMEASVYESLPYHFKLQVSLLEGSAPDDTRQLASIFELLEMNKKKLGIKFYSVTLMNLEQIFIDLSRKQFEADEDFGAVSSRRF